VTLLRIVVSEEIIASIIMVKGITYRDVASSPILFTPIMEVTFPSVLTGATRRHIPADGILL
jgi:hypothetical protein